MDAQRDSLLAALKDMVEVFGPTTDWVDLKGMDTDGEINALEHAIAAIAEAEGEGRMSCRTCGSDGPTGARGYCTPCWSVIGRLSRRQLRELLRLLGDDPAPAMLEALKGAVNHALECDPAYLADTPCRDMILAIRQADPTWWMLDQEDIRASIDEHFLEGARTAIAEAEGRE